MNKSGYFVAGWIAFESLILLAVSVLLIISTHVCK